MRSDRCRVASGDDGTVTAELAASLPVLMLVLAVAVSAVSVAAARVRVQDAAREAVRAAARGDADTGRRMAEHAAPGVSVDLTATGPQLVAVARLQVHPLTGWLPAVTVTERAVAALEPEGAPP